MIEFPPINRGVQALNKFLGLKTPRSPDALSQLVQPVAELLPWWAWSGEHLVRDAAEAIGAAQIGFIAFTSTMTVPLGAAWIVLEWTIRHESLAGAVIQLQGAYDWRNESMFFACGEIAQNSAHPADTLIDCLAGRSSPLYLPANSQLGVNVVVNGGTAQSVSSHARVIQFEA